MRCWRSLNGKPTRQKQSKMQTHLKLLGIVGLLICANGCVTRVVVLDSQSDVVRIGKGMRGEIYTEQADGQWIKQGKATLPEGWYAGPPPK